MQRPADLRVRSLVAHRDALEKAYGKALEWSRNREGVVAKAWIKMPVADPNDRIDWPRQHAWMVDQLVQIERAFSPAIAQALAAYDGGAAEQ